MALKTYEISTNSNNTDQTLVRLETVFLENSFVTFAVEAQPACFSYIFFNFLSHVFNVLFQEGIAVKDM